MADFNDWNAAYQDEDEDEVLDTYTQTTEAFILAIEATPTMLDTSQASNFKNPSPNAPSQSTQLSWKGKQDAQSKMELALRAGLAMMKRKVISCPKDLVGIIVINTAEQDGDIPQSKVIRKLRRITAQGIKDLTDMLMEIEEDPESVQSLFMPSKEDNVFPNVVSRCSGIFRTEAPSKRMNKRLIFITDNDDPFEDNKAMVGPTAEKIKDFRGFDYEIDGYLIPATADSHFDAEKFYGPALAAEGFEDHYPTTVDDLNTCLVAFVSALRGKEAIRRTAFKVPFTLSEKCIIGISGYNLVGEEKKRPPSKVNLNNRVGQDVVLKTYTKDADGKNIIAPAEIKKCFQVGKADPEAGKKATHIFFDDNDMKLLKALGLTTGLSLLGFKPRTRSQPAFNESVKHAHFIVPNEEAYTGSTRTFAALCHSMLEKNVVGYGVLVPRNNAKPQIVVMIPQAEEKKSGVQTKPPGIHLCQLPYVDDKRDHGLTSTASIVAMPTAAEPDPPQPALDIAKKIVRTLTVPYNPDNYPNPALNYHFEAMAAIALDEDMPENPTDTTVPKYKQINQLTAKYTTELKALIPQDQVDLSSIVTSNKSNTKRGHSAAPAVPVGDMSEFISQLREKGLKTTNDELKQALGLLGEKKSGNKAELYERVITSLKSRGLWDDDGEGDESEEEKPRKKAQKRVVADDSDDE